jgi:glucose/arabinose dehydrogenase
MKRSLLLFASIFAFGFLAILSQLVPSAATQAHPASDHAAVPQATVTVEPLPPGAVDVPFASNLEYPIAMTFDSAGRLFYTEKRTNASPNQGRVRLIVGGVVQPSPVITFSIDSSSERGLLGITLDPDFSTNHLVYVYYTAPGSATTNNVARFQEVNGTGINPTIIFSSTQTAGNHNGGNIHFGPDGKLYVSIGDNANAANAQDVTVKNGKMHRLNPDGSPAPGNPVFTQTGALPSLFAIGLRNSFDFTFDPLTSYLFASENGPGCDDEMNRIVGGYNYGWRANYPCDDGNPSPTYNTIPPLWYLPTGLCCQAPTGIEVYSGTSVPQWQNGLFMCTYNNGQLRHFSLDPTRTQVITEAVVSGVTCNMDIATGPDGAFYYIEGGGYSAGTIHRIAGTGPTATPGVPTPSATPGVPTETPTPATPSPTITPGGPTPCSITFNDVPVGSTFYPWIRCLACRGIVGGYPCGGPGEPCPGAYYRPNNDVTRGQVSKIVSESAAFSDPVPSTQQTFEDVPPSGTFWLWVERLSTRGIISGYPCGGPFEPCIGPDNRPYFRPNNNVTRGQLSKITSGAAGWTETPTGQTFEDVPPSQTFYLTIERMAARGIIQGYPCGGPFEPCVGPGNHAYFRPNNPATRGQMAKIAAEAFYPNCQTPAER